MAEANPGNRKASDIEKEKGNKAYTKRDFDVAIAHYDQAYELDRTNITVLCNKAAVFLEQEKIDECIALCNEAIEKGRDVRVDFKVIARAYQRLGNAYEKKEDFENALKFLDKSITEFRNPDVIKRKQMVQTKAKELERVAYINPEIAAEEKASGNKLFMEGKYPEALKKYSEAIKRNPEDAKIYSNRAACYTKLAEFGLALTDCNTCIKLDPTFVKGYIRKGGCHLAMKQYGNAREAYERALEIDPNSKDANTGLNNILTQETPEERRKNAMKDPEVQKILSDPAMQMILQQMQTNPESLRDHLQNPEIAGKISKLMESGVLGIR
ncbi:Stress-induced-phosphoprotein 1-like [Oopsacas minuta]|uniref:Stress-induced-phosphoprotein 1 n=1 Tax=Oopsacas minuta TaxID=111878 RepID=A0AAV7JZG5_9METZ|nr:Stress-induced-phosphoprotein 1-like [Oopsacas minuta]